MEDDPPYRWVTKDSRNKRGQIARIFLDIGESVLKEKHRHSKQYVKIQSGIVVAVIRSDMIILDEGDEIEVEANTSHAFYNVGGDPAKMVFVYDNINDEVGKTVESAPESDHEEFEDVMYFFVRNAEEALGEKRGKKIAKHMLGKLLFATDR